MSFDLTNKNIKDTYQNLLQKTGSDNRLYDLLGNEVGDLRISGSLIAQQYIVSSSVTNISIATLSGSTSFGDSSDDTHTFQGNITASGDISASGKIITHQIGDANGTSDLTLRADNITIQSDTNGDILFREGVASTFKYNGVDNEFIFFKGMDVRGNITASGNISSSGNVISNNLFTTNVSASVIKGPVTFQIESDGVKMLEMQEGSADIIKLGGVGGTDVDTRIETSGDTNAIFVNGGTNNIGIGRNDPDAKLDITGDLKVSTNITASGNISSSGNLTTTEITSSGHFIGQLPPDGGDNVLRYLKTSGNATAVKIEMGDLTGDAGGGTKLVLDDDATKVDISGNLLVSGILSSSGDLTSRAGTIERGFVINNDGGAFATIIKGNTDDNLFLTNVTPSGIDKVAIGTNSFLSKLTINGDLTTTSHITASGNISASGTSHTFGGDLNIISSSNNDNVSLTIRNSSQSGSTNDKATLKFGHVDKDGGKIVSDRSAAYSNDASRRAALEFYTTQGGNDTKKLTISDNAGHLTIHTGSLILTGNDGIVPPHGTGHISASGNLYVRGSGSFDEISANSASFNYITASHIDTDSDTISVGGEAMNKTLIRNLKRGHSSTIVSPAGRIQKTSDLFVNGDISASGDFFKTQFTQMTNSSSILNTFNTASARSSKYVLQVTSASNYQLSEMLVLHTDGAALSTEYAQLNSGLNLVNFSTKVVNQNVQLIASSSFISCSIKYERTIIPT